jgi:Na+/pantothenate symporter
MDIDWIAPFRFAFEIFMFGLGWTLVTVIIIGFGFLSWGIIGATVVTIRNAIKKRNDARMTTVLTSVSEAARTISFNKG